MSAPIELITGLPGNGKTLYAIKYVKELSEREKRPVFYSGIQLGDELKDKWTEIDPEKWFDAPTGAIIVIDECQRVFRPRSLGKEPPDYVAKLETIRHQGLNMVLITQHPLLCDASIRRLTGRHKHCIRKWGTQSSTIHEWPSVRDNCDKPAARKDSEKTPWKFDRKIYSLYKSAELHTVKRNIPKRVWMLLAVPFVLACAAYAVWWLTIGKKHPVAPPSAVAFQPGQVQQGSAGAEKKPWQDPVADAKAYLFNSTPRIAGLQHTAPKYDSVTQPTVAPVPEACVASKTRCKCYSQQGTALDVPDLLCRSIVDRGYFVDFDNSRQQQVQRQKAVYVLDRGGEPLPLSRADTREAGPAVVASADGYGLLGKAGPGVRIPESASQAISR
jgi:zona occludens toxin